MLMTIISYMRMEHTLDAMRRKEQTMAKLLIRLIGAVIGSAPYVAALWMLLNGYGY